MRQYDERTEFRPGNALGHSGAVPPKSLLVPPQTKTFPPCENCSPKKVTDSMPPECSSRPETPKILIITSKLVSKNRSFADSTVKTFFGLHSRILYPTNIVYAPPPPPVTLLLRRARPNFS